MMSNLKRPASESSSTSDPPPRKRPVPDASQPDSLFSRNPGIKITLLRTNLKQFDFIRTHTNVLLPHIYYAVALCSTCTLKTKDYLTEFVDKDTFLKTVSKQTEDFLDVVKRAAASNDENDEHLEALVAHSAFWTLDTKSTLPQSEAIVSRVDREAQQEATLQSWKANFIGEDTLRSLENHIRNLIQPSNQVYARFCSIVQSSGMGKSRLLDEFGKKHLLIPVNLRKLGDEGFPPGDNEVTPFLTEIDHKNGKMHTLSYHRACYFLKALFNETTKTIVGFDVPSKAERIREFRNHMSEGQRWGASGAKRLEFFSTVIAEARKDLKEISRQINDQGLSQTESVIQDTDIPNPASGTLDALLKLRECLNAGDSSETRFVDVFIMFDEAHSLTEIFDEAGRSNFVELRRALQALNKVPLFTFFLSTTGKISQFTPRRGADPSSRVNDGHFEIPRPFINFGFDQLMRTRMVTEKFETLEDVTKLDCIAHMGRPLWGSIYDCSKGIVHERLLEFAAHKLLCAKLDYHTALTEAQKFAVLSQRLPLDVNTTLYAASTTNHFAILMKMQHQISNHMRVCLSIGEGIETIRGIAASEPILSEAASLIMRNYGDFNLPDVLSIVLSGFGISPGDRAELLVYAFFTWARDQAILSSKNINSIGHITSHFSVHALLSSLFSTSAFQSVEGATPSLRRSGSPPIQRVFSEMIVKAWMHFNHLIKPQEQKLLNRTSLLAYMGRGAAALGANGQPGFDAIYPYLYDNIYLDIKNIGFIIVQVKKNDVSKASRAEIFKKMDPFACGLLDESDDFHIPIIRMVFALCSKETVVTPMEYSSPSEGASSIDSSGAPLFTSYDFWCSGIDACTLAPVCQDEKMWVALLEKADPWKSFYGQWDGPQIVRSRLPGCGTDVGHFANWFPYPS